MLETAIKKCFEVAIKRKWDKVYWAVDIHGVIILPTWEEDLPMDMYDGAAEVLKKISDRPDISLILYSCSWPKEIEQYLKLFEIHGIKFDYINRNPEVNNTDYGYYRDKPYFNIVLDDTAGFEPEKDWEMIDKMLSEIPIL